MKKIVYSTLFFAGMFLTTACSDYLEVGSPSIVDSDFVFSNPTTARAALDGAYEQWRDCAQNKVFGDGLFYAAYIACVWIIAGTLTFIDSRYGTQNLSIAS